MVQIDHTLVDVIVVDDYDRKPNRFDIGGDSFFYPVMLLSHIWKGQVNEFVSHPPVAVKLLLCGVLSN